MILKQIHKYTRNTKVVKKEKEGNKNKRFYQKEITPSTTIWVTLPHQPNLEILFRSKRVRTLTIKKVQHSIWRYHLGRGGISEDLKLILTTVWYSASEGFVHLPCPSSNLVYRSLESTLHDLTVRMKMIWSDSSSIRAFWDFVALSLTHTPTPHLHHLPTPPPHSGRSVKGDF